MPAFESISLIQDPIEAPTQLLATDTKYPCTGFCYLSATDRNLLVEMYFERDSQGYYQYISYLINQAGIRKQNNPEIPEEGEYIDAPTIMADFPDLVATIEFTEMGVVGGEEKEIEINNICMLLLTSPISGPIFVNRSNESILFVRLDKDTFFVIDSHQPVHGVLSLLDVVKYITRDGQIRGFVQIGIQKDP